MKYGYLHNSNYIKTLSKSPLFIEDTYPGIGETSNCLTEYLQLQHIIINHSIGSQSCYLISLLRYLSNL